MEITNYKSQTTNNTQITNNKSQTDPSNNSEKGYDLEGRTLEFAKSIIRICKKLQNNAFNGELIKQVVRSGCSVGANYREANEALGKKDFCHRLRISRKECKETSYWLELIEENNQEHSREVKKLYIESLEIRSILSAIIDKSHFSSHRCL